MSKKVKIPKTISDNKLAYYHRQLNNKLRAFRSNWPKEVNYIVITDKKIELSLKAGKDLDQKKEQDKSGDKIESLEKSLAIRTKAEKDAKKALAVARRKITSLEGKLAKLEEQIKKVSKSG